MQTLAALGGRVARVCASAMAGVALALAAHDASAQTMRIVPSISGQIEATDNVNLSPSGDRRSDFVTQVTPALAISERGAHTTLFGTVSAPVVFYANGGGNSTVNPNVNLTGNTELVERLLFVDASASVSQQYFSPFGPRPQDLTNTTSNRYTAESYRVSPYLKGVGRDGLSYTLRDSNTWINASGAPTSTNQAYTNDISGNVTRAAQPVGWAVDYDRSESKFTSQGTLRSEIGRARAVWRPDPQYEVFASTGYEDNRYPLASFSGATYGAGVTWHPTDRTNVVADYEHRYFGASYRVQFDHHTPLSVWTLRASRDATSAPQHFANLSAGEDISALLNQLFASRFTDPTQRQTFIDQLIRDRGLPSVLSSPLALYTQQITLQESVQATMGLLGVRNAVFVTLFRTRNQAIVSAGSGIPDLFSAQSDNTQTGINTVWTYKLTPLYTLATSADWSHVVANDSSGARSNQGTLRIALSAPLSPLTNVFAGARYQRFTSNLQSGYNESAIFAGVSHVFR